MFSLYSVILWCHLLVAKQIMHSSACQEITGEAEKRLDRLDEYMRTPGHIGVKLSAAGLIGCLGTIN